MIIGIGTDIIEIARIKKAARKESFVKRVYTDIEARLCAQKPDFYASLAVRFAAKEAVLKAMGTGLRGCKWRDIEILSEVGGTPKVVLYGEARKQAWEKGISKVLISLSHSEENAVAFCVAEGGGGTDGTGYCGRNEDFGPEGNQ